MKPSLSTLQLAGIITGMNKGKRLQPQVEAFVRGSKGRKGAGEKGHHESSDRMRAEPRGHDDCEQRDHRDVEDCHPDPPPARSMNGKKDPIGGRELAVLIGGSARGSSSSVTPTTYAKERFKYEMIGGRREELDSNGHLLPHGFHYIGP
ncbi:hypothetical protein Dimus_015250 [Dionaea muscipula]